MTKYRCDYLIIGAGAAGCVVAGRLSEQGSTRVILAEAGGDNRHILTRIPGIAFLASVSPKRNWNFATEPIPGLGNRRMNWHQGRLLGGSSSINGMIYMRGHSREYDHWRQLGCEGWSFDGVLPYFRKSESSARGNNQWHGANGPFATRPSNTSLPICSAFLNAARDAGYPVVDDLNADIAEGFGRYDINVRNGQRVSSAAAFVKPALRRENFALLLGRLATRIVVERGRAVAAEFHHEGQKEIVEVDREIILCGGAINSPQLLMLSGVGPADHLRERGVSVVVDSPEVGRNLSNHPAYTLRFACSGPVTAYHYRRPHKAVGIGLRYGLTRGGPLGESFVAQGGVFRTDPSLSIADSIVVMVPALVARGSVGGRYSDLFPAENGFGVSVSLGRPLSRGNVSLRSADPAAHPAIQPNYLADPNDARTLVRAVRIMRGIMRQPSIRPMITRELQPGETGTSDAEMEQHVRDNCGSYSHPMGTCRMGGDERAVLDPQLRVRGVAGLRVADASIMPTPLNACTHGPSIMIGEKAASFIMTPATAAEPYATEGAAR